MRQFFILFQKETLESWRNFKWIWMPISFILLGIMDPLTQHFLPQILDSVGDLPEGAVIQLPTPSAAEVLTMSLSQFNMIGVLILVLATMAAIAGERKSGVAAMILVKPVSYFSFVTAKWLSTLLMMWISYFIGMLSAWYYVGLLFEFIPFADFIQSFFIYGCWLSLVITITIFYNTFLKTAGLVGFITLATIILLTTLTGIFSNWLPWSPAQIMSYAGGSLVSEGLPEHTIETIIFTIVTIFILLSLSVVIFRKKELED
ncbi:MAG TPA: ABC transporter permease subunit [Pseudoneobacillus sp.]|jgi:ABC-2 type transport system permease protein|nr:ABC transporter permease subunit [Pseudoneobacillus sp.]